MSTSRDDVVQAALQLERDGRKFYLDAAAKAANDVVRSWFEAFANDELRHMEWIEQLVAEEKTVKAAKREFYGRLSGIFRDAPESARKAALGSEDDLQAMRLATEMEEKSVAAYARWAEESDDEGLRDLCNVLADYERTHVELLENASLYLEDPAEWFRREERWIVEG